RRQASDERIDRRFEVRGLHLVAADVRDLVHALDGGLDEPWRSLASDRAGQFGEEAVRYRGLHLLRRWHLADRVGKLRQAARGLAAAALVDLGIEDEVDERLRLHVLGIVGDEVLDTGDEFFEHRLLPRPKIVTTTE